MTRDVSGRASRRARAPVRRFRTSWTNASAPSATTANHANVLADSKWVGQPNSATYCDVAWPLVTIQSTAPSRATDPNTSSPRAYPTTSAKKVASATGIPASGAMTADDTPPATTVTPTTVAQRGRAPDDRQGATSSGDRSPAP